MTYSFQPATMLVALTLISLGIFPLTKSEISYQTSNENGNLKPCLSHIIKDYFSKYSKLTYIDLHNVDQEIIKVVNTFNFVTLLTKTTQLSTTSLDESYLISAENSTNLIHRFPIFKKDPSWNPNGRFLILIDNLIKDDLTQIFDTLLKYHIIDVLVVTKYLDPELYTYNPFENYGCGRYYSRIIGYGKCKRAQQKNLYPHKLFTGLENCTIKIVSPHWPPYSIDPLRRRKNSKNSYIGIEEFILREISVLEKFSINLTFTDDAETFTTITRDMSAIGPLYLLQENKADIIVGGMILTHPRAKAFSYIYGHLSFTEDIRYQVKISSTVPSWKNIYLEFQAIVWTLFILTFVMFFMIFIILVKPKDKGQVILKMFAYLFLHGRKIGGNSFTKYLFIMWIWFAYLINTYYQSSLVSLIANPSLNYQISNEIDLVKYNLKPCVSHGMRNYLLSVENISLEKNEHEGCETMLESIKTVSKSNDIYTISLYSLYKYNIHKFFDEWGNPLVHSFDQPLSKIVYAIYLYKGFPMLEKLRVQVLRLRENGMIENYIKNMYWRKTRKHNLFEKRRESYVLVPWYVLAGGYALSTGVFFLEILIKKYSSKKPNLLVHCHE